MNFYKLVASFVYSNFILAIAAVCQGLLTFLYLGISADFSLLFYLFTSTFLAYHVQVFVFNKPDRNLITNHEKLLWLIKHKRTIRLLSLALIPFVAVLFLEFNTKVKFAIGIQFLLVLAYYFPLFHREGFRVIPGFKLFMISTAWTIGVVIIPLLHANLELLSNKSILFILERFMLITALTLAFDLRDFNTDAKHQLKTIPHLIGIPLAKKFAMALLLIFFGISVLNLPTIWVISSGIVGILSTVLLAKANPYRHAYFYAIGIDGMLILQFVLAILIGLI